MYFRGTLNEVGAKAMSVDPAPFRMTPEAWEARVRETVGKLRGKTGMEILALSPVKDHFFLSASLARHPQESEEASMHVQTILDGRILLQKFGLAAEAEES